MDIIQAPNDHERKHTLNKAKITYFSFQFVCYLLWPMDGHAFKRYALQQDAAPLLKIDVTKIPDARPRDEPLSRYGNASTYMVLGKKYSVLKTAHGYRQRGIASWYGMKFHMHLTSNREPYDLLKMTAAHRSLPIPTYVRVTNLSNKKTVIVRVNDRGPFVPTRIIDLSYVAAKKLDMLSTGTAFVEVEAITPKKRLKVSRLVTPTTKKPVKRNTQNKLQLQVGSFQNTQRASQYAKLIKQIINSSIQIKRVKKGNHFVYRIIIGPIKNTLELKTLQKRLQKKGFDSILI